MSCASHTRTVDELQVDYDDAKTAVMALRTLVAEGKVNADALSLAEYRLHRASKRLTAAVTDRDGAA